jgi:hypothetical protein
MDLTTLQIALTAFIVLAGVAIAMAVAALVVVATDARRRHTGTVVPMAGSPGVAATGRRAA